MRVIVLGAAAIALGGCAGLGLSSGTETTYIRADGQPVAQEQVDADLSSCSSTFASGDKAYNCMLTKGYFLVEVKDAAAKQAQFTQIQAEKRRQEEARIAEEIRKQKELERAAQRLKKKKPKPPALRQ
jgi:hypothetical protein